MVMHLAAFRRRWSIEHPGCDFRRCDILAQYPASPPCLSATIAVTRTSVASARIAVILLGEAPTQR